MRYMTSIPHPNLQPLLNKHGVSWGDFSRKGRLPAHLRWVAEKRRDIITELHASGMPWTRMTEVTGLSLMAIQRGTRATWNAASKRNRQENAARVGRQGKGREKPWLTDQLKKAWAEGSFDFHFGRTRSMDEVARQRAGYTSEVRQRMSRKKVAYMKAHPQYPATQRGKRSWVHTPKSLSGRIHLRSSYEAKAIQILEARQDIAGFLYEPLFEGSLLPDFLVLGVEGELFVVEVKPLWVLQSTHPVAIKQQRKIEAYRAYASRQGWPFEVWSEKDLGLC